MSVDICPRTSDQIKASITIAASARRELLAAGTWSEIQNEKLIAEFNDAINIGLDELKRRGDL